MAETTVPSRVRLWPLALGTFAIGFGTNVLTGLLPTMTDELEVSLADIGRLLSFYGVAYAISTPLVALFGGRLPRRALMLAALGFFAVASIGTALATDYATLAVLRAVSAVAAGGFTPTATVLAARLVPPGVRGRALATVFGGLTTAAVVAAPVGNILGPLLGYRGIYLLTAGLAVIALVAVATLVAVPHPGSTSAPAAAIGRLSPLVVLVLLVSMLETAAAFTVQTYASPLLTAISGADGVSLSALLLCYGAAGVLGNIAGGRMVDRLGATRTLWVCLLGCALGLVLLPVVGGTLVGAGAVFAVWGFLAWASNTPIQGMLIVLAGRHSQLVVALNSSIIALGTAAGAAIGGAVIAGTGIMSLAFWGAGIMGMAVLVVTVLAIVRRGGEN